MLAQYNNQKGLVICCRVKGAMQLVIQSKNTNTKIQIQNCLLHSSKAFTMSDL